MLTHTYNKVFHIPFTLSEFSFPYFFPVWFSCWMSEPDSLAPNAHLSGTFSITCFCVCMCMCVCVLGLQHFVVFDTECAAPLPFLYLFCDHRQGSPTLTHTKHTHPCAAPALYTHSGLHLNLHKSLCFNGSIIPNTMSVSFPRNRLHVCVSGLHIRSFLKTSWQSLI